MNPNWPAIDHAIEVLNRAIVSDPEAMNVTGAVKSAAWRYETNPGARTRLVIGWARSRRGSSAS